MHPRTPTDRDRRLLARWRRRWGRPADLERDLRCLARWERWSRVADRRARWGRPGAADAATAMATVWARRWLAPARAELLARGAVLDVSRW